MDITEVRVKLTEDSDDRLQAFCSITFDDCFVVRDLKIIEGTNGPFVAMPSRKLTSHCPRCRSKNHLRSHYCNHCGTKLNSDRAARDQDGRAKLYADIAHPINSACREMIQQRVIAEYREELELAKKPGYISRYEDDYDDDFIPAQVLDEADEESAEPEEQPDEQLETQSAPDQTFARTDSEPEAQGPHTPPSRQGSEKKPGTPHSQYRQNKNFGAGIFED